MELNRRLIGCALSAGLAFVLVGASRAEAGEAELNAALGALKGHVDGTAPLTGAQIATHKQTIDNNSSIFGDTAATIQASFDLISTYDSEIGAMWTVGSPTENTFYREDMTDENLHWAMFHVMQNILDNTYTPANIQTYGGNGGLLNGYKFGTAEYFPGHVEPPSNPNESYTVSIDGSFLNTWGRDTMHWQPGMSDPPRQESAARKATGTYLTPGSVATITVPASLVGQGYVVRVGGNSWDLSNKNPIDRLDRVSLEFPIDSTSIEVASPLGGNIYIEVPFEADAGVVDVDIKNVVRSPFFSAQDHHMTTLNEWQTVERNNLAPWADFQSEKFNLHVPTGWIFALEDPVTLMQNWDKALDVTNDLMGFPRDRGKETLFDGVDVRIRAGAYAPGYPTVNSTYDAHRNNDASDYSTASNAYTGNQGSHLVQGPSPNSEVEFHELGHAYLFPKLPGETESTVNLLHVAVFNQAFGYDIDYAFRTSCRGFVNNEHRSLNNAAVTWMASFNFTKRVPMDKLEKQYQLKGHAKFVEVARVFGWDKLGDYYRSFNEDYEALGYTPSYDTNDHLLRLSKAIGGDVTPLFHFWGVHPDNLTELRAELLAEGIRASQEVHDLLLHYKTLIPADNAAFQQFCMDWWQHQPNPDGYWTESEHAQQWDTYDANSAAAIAEVIDELHDLYFPSPFVGYPIADLNRDDTVDGADWLMFIAGNHADMMGLSEEDAYVLGDLDGDGDNDIDDFAKFKEAYDLYHPTQGAFEAMVASYVPEPGTILLLAIGAAGMVSRRTRRA